MEAANAGCAQRLWSPDPTHLRPPTA